MSGASRGLFSMLSFRPEAIELTPFCDYRSCRFLFLVSQLTHPRIARQKHDIRQRVWMLRETLAMLLKQQKSVARMHSESYGSRSIVQVSLHSPISSR